LDSLDSLDSLDATIIYIIKDIIIRRKSTIKYGIVL